MQQLSVEAQRHAEDLQAWTRARELDASAEELLCAALGAETVAAQLHAAVGSTSSHFLRRQAMTKLAATTREARAARATFAAASRIWWEFAQRHERLIHSVAKRYARRSAAAHPDLDDIRMVLVEATVRAAVDWEPSRGKFVTMWSYVARTMWQLAPERQCTVHMGTRQWRVAPCGPGPDAGRADEEHAPRAAWGGEPAAVLHSARVTAADAHDVDLARAISKLPRDSAQIVVRAVIHEEPVVQIAKDLGVPRFRVAAQLQEAIEYLRRELSAGTAPEVDSAVLTLVAN